MALGQEPVVLGMKMPASNWTEIMISLGMLIYYTLSRSQFRSNGKDIHWLGTTPRSVIIEQIFKLS